MQLITLTADNEKQLFRFLEADYCDYYFFIYDYLLQKAKTKIFFAQNNDAVQGLMVQYDGHIAQLRGDEAIVRFMLNNLAPQFTDVQVPQKCEKLLFEKYPEAKLKANVTLMRLNKGQEHLAITTQPQKLNIQDAAEIAELMHVCYPKMWSDIPKEAIETIFAYKEAAFLGIKEGDKLAAFGYAMLTPKVSHVTWIGTNPEYERRGYATSIVSSLIQESLQMADTAIIYVMNDNATANGVYSHVGFRPYKEYAFIKK
jgi:ribosomal protein S18 acetylase RimI-like enzyme